VAQNQAHVGAMARKSTKLDDATRSFLETWRGALSEDRLAHIIRVAARAFKRSLELRLSEVDVSFGHWIFLRILWESDGLTQHELAVMAGVMEPTAHTALQNMRDLGYVRRTHLPGNRKKVHIFLTDAGKALKDKLLPLAVDANDISAAGISAKDIDITRATLLAMVTNLEADEAQAMDQGRRVISTQAIGRRHLRKEPG
jgi:DNA-binding MarR family transcriptional regulator